METQLTSEQIAQIGDALTGGNKIEAIKLYRAATGADLKAAKDFIETLTLQLQARDPAKYAKAGQTGKGCVAGSAAVLLVVVLAVYVLS